MDIKGALDGCFGEREGGRSMSFEERKRGRVLLFSKGRDHAFFYFLPEFIHPSPVARESYHRGIDTSM